ncbi:DUF7683 domain-containing protein [Aliivibrio fischeri]|uniref:DUF7683 domain-containing protein n=1 Tax=Aliivibrio fischeri TaxID=668 RepID=UPI003735B2B0
MYELNFFDKDTEELIHEFELINLNDEHVFSILGFSLDGNCADISKEYLLKIERYVDLRFSSEDYDISICQV